MSKGNKALSLRIIFGVLIASVLLLGALAVVNLNHINRLEKQIDNLKNVNQSLIDDSVSEFVILNFVDIDGSIKPYRVNKNLNMSIYDFLLTTPDFSDSDFASFDGENYYFDSSLTDVIELMDNQNFYVEDEWGTFLVVGLQAIILNQDYTVVRTAY